ncbi:unnamed protein product [Symbiodinium sp. CCMP2592]|nr:unnamed protein product [Symbiodinium sp. CCMP2592]
MSSTDPSSRPSAAEAIAGLEREEGPPTKVPKLEDTMAEMRLQHMMMMKMFQESQQSMIQMMEGAATQAASNAVRMMRAPNPKLPDAIVQCIDKTSLLFMKDVRKYARSAKTYDDARAKYTIMSEDTQSKRYPPGIRPFASSTTFGELDEAWTETRGGNTDIKVTIPSGTCRRDAMRIIHHSMTRLIKSIELEALQAHRDTMVTFANKDTLRTKCIAAIDEVVAKDADVRNLAIDSPDRLTVDPVLVNSKVDDKYNQVVKKVIEEISKAEEKKDKDRLKEEKDKKEFSQQSPENILKNLVSHFVSEEVSKHQAHDDEAMEIQDGAEEAITKDEQNFNQHDAVTQLVEVFRGSGKGKGQGARTTSNGQNTKNGQSPGAAPGQHAPHATSSIGNGKGWYHKKHILCTKVLPRIDHVVQDLNHWGNRLKWQWYHRADSGSRPSITVRYRKLPTCDHLIAPEVEWMVRNMRECVLSEYQKAISRVRYNRSYTNVLPLTSWGLRLLRQSGLKAIPNDKDGGYALETEAEHKMVHLELLTNGVYEEFPTFMTRTEIDNAFNSYSLICSMIANSVVNPSWPGNCGNLCSTDLNKRMYLVKDTAQFIKSISSYTATPNHFFMKLDIKDYYLSGTSEELCGACSKVIRSEILPLFTTTLMTLLYYQFVESRELPERIWRVTKGTGMGLPHSGEVADSAFAALAEDPWAVKRTIQAHHGIDGYWRFRDDILILGSNRQRAKEFFWELRKLAAFFKVQCEAWNAEEIQFLEVTVKKNVNTGRFETMPKYRHKEGKNIKTTGANERNKEEEYIKMEDRPVTAVQSFMQAKRQNEQCDGFGASVFSSGLDGLVRAAWAEVEAVALGWRPRLNFDGCAGDPFSLAHSCHLHLAWAAEIPASTRLMQRAAPPMSGSAVYHLAQIADLTERTSSAAAVQAMDEVRKPHLVSCHLQPYAATVPPRTPPPGSLQLRVQRAASTVGHCTGTFEVRIVLPSASAFVPMSTLWLRRAQSSWWARETAPSRAGTYVLLGSLQQNFEGTADTTRERLNMTAHQTSKLQSSEPSLKLAGSGTTSRTNFGSAAHLPPKISVK